MTCTLLIWNEFDNGLRLFLIPKNEQSAEDEEALTQVHETYINACEDITEEQQDAQEYILACIAKQADHAPDAPKHLIGRFNKYQLTEMFVGVVKISQIVEAGFIP